MLEITNVAILRDEKTDLNCTTDDDEKYLGLVGCSARMRCSLGHIYSLSPTKKVKEVPIFCSRPTGSKFGKWHIMDRPNLPLTSCEKGKNSFDFLKEFFNNFNFRLYRGRGLHSKGSISVQAMLSQLSMRGFGVQTVLGRSQCILDVYEWQDWIQGRQDMSTRLCHVVLT